MWCSEITGYGAYLPEKVMTNDEIAQFVDTSDEWIRERSGICQRHMTDKKTMTSDLALEASKKALEKANIKPEDIDLLILATTTPDLSTPATAARLQARLGMTKGFAFDVQAACSGFIYGLSLADSQIQTGRVKTVLLVASETLTKLLDWEDRATCVLFGDGAGAVVLQAKEEQDETSLKQSRVYKTFLYSDGNYVDCLRSTGGISETMSIGKPQMDGKEVFRHAVVNMENAAIQCLKEHNITLDDVDWVVPHQANKRIIDFVQAKLQIPNEKLVITVDKHANTSAASIPLALNDALFDERIKKGDLILLVAMGAGFTWGSSLIRL